MDFVGSIRKLVLTECSKPSSKYGCEPFEFHFVPMVKYAEQLADELGADKEVVLIASWLHDIGSIIHGRKNHHISGAMIAERELNKLEYPPDKIELVKKCILNHRGSSDNRRESLEEKIVAEADAMSNFDNIGGIFKAAYVYENLDQGAAKESVRQKLQRKWQGLHFEKSKNIIRTKYDAAMILLS